MIENCLYCVELIAILTQFRWEVIHKLCDWVLIFLNHLPVFLSEHCTLILGSPCTMHYEKTRHVPLISRDNNDPRMDIQKFWRQNFRKSSIF